MSAAIELLKQQEADLLAQLERVRAAIAILRGDDEFNEQQNIDLYQNGILPLRALNGIRAAFNAKTGELKNHFTALEIYKALSYRDLIRLRNIGKTSADQVKEHLLSVGLIMREK